MPKRKPRPTPKPRRNSYDRALEQASKRLDTAVAERETYSQRLKALDEEIPRLQAMIRGIESFFGAAENRMLKSLKSLTMDKYAPQNMAAPYTTAPIVPPALRKFIEPRAVDTDDENLPDPTGSEVLE